MAYADAAGAIKNDAGVRLALQVRLLARQALHSRHNSKWIPYGATN